MSIHHAAVPSNYLLSPKSCRNHALIVIEPLNWLGMSQDATQKLGLVHSPAGSGQERDKRSAAHDGANMMTVSFGNRDDNACAVQHNSRSRTRSCGMSVVDCTVDRWR